jgi:hypothetical protein
VGGVEVNYFKELAKEVGEMTRWKVGDRKKLIGVLAIAQQLSRVADALEEQNEMRKKNGCD